MGNEAQVAAGLKGSFIVLGLAMIDVGLGGRCWGVLATYLVLMLDFA
jgi:hypothetical protein